MFNLLSRRLFHVGKHLGNKLCKDTNATIGATVCAATAAGHRAPISYALGRNYCNTTDDGSNVATPTVLAPDVEAEIKLKEILQIPEKERLKKIIELEIEIMKQNNELVPEEIKPRHWYELMTLESRSKRKRYLTFVWKIEKKRENARKERDEKLKQHLERVAEATEPSTIYRLGDNAMFLRFYDSSINHALHRRLINRMLFGQQIVLDCGYEDAMSRREMRDCAKQLQFTFAANRIHDDPFDLHLCNVNLHGELMKHLTRYIPTIQNPDFPLHIRTDSYLNAFDKEKLIYLTPHCHQEMNEFDHDAVYIIGALVDKATHEPLSMAKAKKEGIRMLKFPLDRHLQWGACSGKNLTLNQVINILLDFRKTGSWDEALRHVPRRKLSEARIHNENRKFGMLSKSESSTDDENYTLPVQEIKPKDRFIYRADRSHRKKIEDRDDVSTKKRDTEAPFGRDFTMSARKKFGTNLKN